METTKVENVGIKMEKSNNELIINKLKSAKKLKDYAISENLDIPNDVIESLNISLDDASKIDESELDKAIRDLTSRTYPTTIKTIDATDKLRPTRFLYSLSVLSFFVLILAVIGYIEPEIGNKKLWQSILNFSLGMLGALVYVFFNLIGVMKAQAFEPDATFENSLRIILGGILGWLFYYTFKDKTLASQGANNTNFIFVLLPFLAGFSTRLVFGVLNQAIRAFEITLGMENTSSKILRRPKSEKNHIIQANR